MALKVIGAGFGRTGTLSMKLALEQLGFGKCYHMLEVNKNESHRTQWAKAHRGDRIDWDALFDGYQSTVDWPSCNLWRQQAAHFPEAKILLTLRDPDSWYESVMKTIFKSSKDAIESDDATIRFFGQWAFELIWDRIFDGRMEDRSFAIDTYNRHNRSVIDEVPADRLLVFEAKQGWAPLCEFLGVPTPDSDYPRTNTTDEFLSRVKSRE